MMETWECVNNQVNQVSITGNTCETKSLYVAAGFVIDCSKAIASMMRVPFVGTVLSVARYNDASTICGYCLSVARQNMKK